MALAPLLLLALVAAGAAAAWNRSESTPPEREPSPDPRARIPEDLTLCRTSADAVSLLDPSALVRWVSCAGRTAPEVAQLVARLEAQAEQFPSAGYAETARSVRTRWNERLDLEDARAAELARSRSPRPAPRPSRPARPAERTPPNRPSASSAVSASSTSSASSASTLAGELERAEREHPGARASYAEVMRDGTPSELRAAADWIEDQDPSYREIPRALRRRAVEREGARR